MNAAASSWCTRTILTLSWWRRSPSMIPLIPSPGRPKIVSTPQAANCSTRASLTSAFAISVLRSVAGGSVGGQSAGQQLGQVQTADAAQLVQLRAAGEPVGQDGGAGLRVANARQQHPLRAGPADLEVAA